MLSFATFDIYLLLFHSHHTSRSLLIQNKKWETKRVCFTSKHDIIYDAYVLYRCEHIQCRTVGLKNRSFSFPLRLHRKKKTMANQHNSQSVRQNVRRIIHGGKLVFCSFWIVAPLRLRDIRRAEQAIRESKQRNSCLKYPKEVECEEEKKQKKKKTQPHWHLIYSVCGISTQIQCCLTFKNIKVQQNYVFFFYSHKNQ